MPKRKPFRRKRDVLALHRLQFKTFTLSRKIMGKSCRNCVVDAERHSRTRGCRPFERKAIQCEMLANARDAGMSQPNGTDI